MDTVSRAVTSMHEKVEGSIQIVAHADTARVHVGEEVLFLTGLSARRIREVVAFDGPLNWEVLARKLWPDEDDRNLLCRKLEVTLYRLRKTLRGSNIRPDLARSDGFGQVELFLHAGDVIEDRA